MGKIESVLVLVFGALFLLSVILLMNHGIRTTGYATTAQTTSNVTITNYFAIDMSDNLTTGIQFGSVDSLPVTNLNGSGNYDWKNTSAQGTYLNASNGTSYWLNVSTDSNTNVDFCIKAEALNTSGGDTFALANETYYNDSVTNQSRPANASEVGLTTSFVKSGFNVTVGSNNYYRFWLDVPSGIAAGTYDNYVYFEGKQTGTGCTA